jgi:hypothetical protein
MGRGGTCLSRSLSIASRCTGSAVVIGVERKPYSDQKASIAPSAFAAHAWVEIGGVALLDGPPGAWTEIGRIDMGIESSTFCEN